MYEYKVMKTDQPTVSEKQLAEFGKDRWRLQCILEWQGQFYYYFIREKLN